MKHGTTKFTPFSLIYGREAKLPIETIVESYYEEDLKFYKALLKRTFEIEDVLIKQQNKALENIQTAQQNQQKHYNKYIKHNKLKISDKVLVAKSFLKNVFSAKLEEQFIEPYIIHSILDFGVYKLQTLDDKKA